MLHNFKERKLEWSSSIEAVCLGIFFALPMDSMSTAYAYSTYFFSELVWGFLYLIAGSFLAFALQINGRATWTPKVRVTALLALGQLYLANTIAIYTTHPQSALWLLFFLAAVLRCGITLIAASYDVRKLSQKERVVHGH